MRIFTKMHWSDFQISTNALIFLLKRTWLVYYFLILTFKSRYWVLLWTLVLSIQTRIQGLLDPLGLLTRGFEHNYIFNPLNSPCQQYNNINPLTSSSALSVATEKTLVELSKYYTIVVYVTLDWWGWAFKVKFSEWFQNCEVWSQFMYGKFYTGFQWLSFLH